MDDATDERPEPRNAQEAVEKAIEEAFGRYRESNAEGGDEIGFDTALGLAHALNVAVSGDVGLILAAHLDRINAKLDRLLAALPPEAE